MQSLIYLIVSLANVYTMVIFVYVLMSWFPIGSTGFVAEIKAFLGKLCDPFLDIFKKFIPPIGGMVDISPILALIVLQFAVRIIVGILS